MNLNYNIQRYCLKEVCTMNMANLLLTGLVTASKNPATAVVVATGLILVFGVLVLLYFIVILQGKIFTSIDNKKNGKPQAPQAPKVAPKAATAAVAKPAMQVEKGIPGEIVAAIAAAVSCMDGGNYTIKSVKRAKQSGRNAWGQAGVISYTEPF